MPERGEGVVNNRATEVSRGTWADIWRIEYLVTDAELDKQRIVVTGHAASRSPSAMPR